MVKRANIVPFRNIESDAITEALSDVADQPLSRRGLIRKGAERLLACPRCGDPNGVMTRSPAVCYCDKCGHEGPKYKFHARCGVCGLPLYMGEEPQRTKKGLACAECADAMEK